MADARTVSSLPIALARGGRARPVRRLVTRYKMATATGLLLGLIVLVAVFAGAIAPYDPAELVARPFLPFSPRHIFGTDQFGRDVFSRIVYGARVSMLVGVASIVVSLALGLTIGVVSGYRKGRLDLVLQRVVDIFIVLPGLILALVFVARLGPGLQNTVLAIGIVQGPRVARVIRGAVLSLSEQPYVEAARTVGCSEWRIMGRHLAPNTLPVALTLATSLMGQAIIIEASLSFLGLGIQPPTPSWGQLLSSAAQQHFIAHPWLAVVPGAVITLTVLLANMFGDAIQEALDPRMRGTR
jgi:peptide/nickel transport system permease protein